MAGSAATSASAFLGAEPTPAAPASPASSASAFLGPEAAPGAASPATPAPSALTEVGNAAGIVGEHLAHGAISGVAAPDAILSSLYNNYIKPHLPSAVATAAEATRGPVSSSEALSDLSKRIPFDYFKPRGGGATELGENLLGIAAEGAGAALPAIAMGAAPLMTLAAGSSGSLASAGAEKLGAPGWMQIIAGLVPGLALGGWQHSIDTARNADKAAADLAAAKASKESANELLAGGQVNVPGNPLTEANSATTASKLNADVQLSRFKELHDQAHEATKAAIADESTRRTNLANSAIEGVANAHGESASLQEAEQKLQEYGRGWLQDQFPAKQEEAWAPVDAKIGGRVPTPLNNFYDALREIKGQAGVLDPLTKQLQPALPEKLLTTLESKLPKDLPEELGGAAPSGDISSLLDSQGNPQPITWSDTRRLRSVLGDAMSNPKTVNDIGRANTSKLYRALTQDLGNTALENNASNEFEQANVQSKKLYDIAEGPLASLVGDKEASLRSDPSSGKAASFLLNSAKSGDKELEALKSQGFPVAELTAAKLREDPDGARKWWNGLSPEGQNSLVPNPAHRNVLQEAMAVRDEAGASAKAQLAVANAQHKAGLAQAKGMLEFGPATSEARASALGDSLGQNRLAAQQQLTQAQAAFDALPKDDRVVNIIKSAQRSHLGELAGAGLDLALRSGGISPDLHGMLAHGAELAGAAAAGLGAAKAGGLVYQGGKNLLTSPSMSSAAAPAAALLGANAEQLQQGR